MNNRDNATIDDKIDTEHIMRTIISSGRLGAGFIPETDGKEMIRKLLPIDEAIAAGKGSELYQNITSTYKEVMGILIKMQETGSWNYTPKKAQEVLIEIAKDRTKSIYGIRTRREGPYRGTYGKYSEGKGYCVSR